MAPMCNRLCIGFGGSWRYGLVPLSFGASAALHQQVNEIPDRASLKPGVGMVHRC